MEYLSGDTFPEQCRVTQLEDLYNELATESEMNKVRAFFF